MIKLAELIRRATRTEAGPIGFGAAPRKAPSTIVLVAEIGRDWAKGAGEAVAAGADAVLLTGAPGESDLAAAVAAAKEAPCGLAAPDADAAAAVRLRDANLAFLVLSSSTSASALQDEKGCFILHITRDLTDAQLRTLEALPLDAIALDWEATPLTIGRQMELRRVNGLSRLPLMLRVAANVGEQELLSLREAGVTLAAVEGGTDAIRQVRAGIDGLPARRGLRREEREPVALPHGARVSAPTEEDEGDEDDEDGEEE